MVHHFVKHDLPRIIVLRTKAQHVFSFLTIMDGSLHFHAERVNNCLEEGAVRDEETWEMKDAL